MMDRRSPVSFWKVPRRIYERGVTVVHWRAPVFGNTFCWENVKTGGRWWLAGGWKAGACRDSVVVKYVFLAGFFWLRLVSLGNRVEYRVVFLVFLVFLIFFSVAHFFQRGFFSFSIFFPELLTLFNALISFSTLFFQKLLSIFFFSHFFSRNRAIGREIEVLYLRFSLKKTSMWIGVLRC